MNHINLLLVDDEELFRQGLRSMLEKEAFVGQIHEAGNAADFNEQMAKHPVDIVLLDMKLPGMKGPELFMSLVKKPSRPKVIAVTGLEGIELIVNLLKSGINGIVCKLDGYSEIVKSILEVLKYGHYFHEKTLKVIQTNSHRWDKVPAVTLTFHENELMRAIARGLTTKMMAAELKMAESTTETYRIRLMKKLGVPNTAALLAYAYRNGIL